MIEKCPNCSYEHLGIFKKLVLFGELTTVKCFRCKKIIFTEVVYLATKKEIK